jgi:hypothetical protein
MQDTSSNTHGGPVLAQENGDLSAYVSIPKIGVSSGLEKVVEGNPCGRCSTIPISELKNPS